MKRLSLYLFLILFALQTPSQADDVRDFQIEGMSLGDSALDYFTEEEIENSKEDYYKDYKPEKFIAIEVTFRNFEVYDAIQFGVKKRDKKYIIYYLKGMIDYTKNIDDCYKKQIEVDKELSELFTNFKMTRSNHKLPDGGTVKSINYWFPSGDLAEIDCYDFNDDKGWIDHIRIGIKTKEVNDWLLKNQ